MAEAVFETIKRAPAYKVVEQSIRKSVLDGTLSVGSMLPGETELAEQLGVTRPTVREAFRSLENSGLIGRGRRRRMVVTAPAAHVVSDAMHNSMVLHGVSYRELWEVNIALEPAAADLAARRVANANVADEGATEEEAANDGADSGVLQAIEANLEWTSRVLADADELAKADIEFHELVAQASGNRALLLAREPLGQLLLPAYRTVIREIGPGRRLFEAHTRIFEAIRAADSETAREWMTRHIVDFRRGCELAGLDLDDPVVADDR